MTVGSAAQETRIPSTIEPLVKARLTPPPTSEIDPPHSDTLRPLTYRLRRALYPITRGTAAACYHETGKIDRDEAGANHQAIGIGGSCEILYELVRARVIYRLAPLDFDRSFSSRVLRDSPGHEG